MTVATSRPLTQNQTFRLPGYHSWEEFQAIKTVISHSGVRLSYLDGELELMTLGEQHESISRAIAALLTIYCWQEGLAFYSVGSATRESKDKSVSFEPDESYYFGQQRERPDLAIEINITSGSPQKLEKYKRFKIKEVWMWQNNRLLIFSLENNEYEPISQSKILPELDISLLAECALMSCHLEAIKKFTGK